MPQILLFFAYLDSITATFFVKKFTPYDKSKPAASTQLHMKRDGNFLERYLSVCLCVVMIDFVESVMMYIVYLQITLCGHFGSTHM